MQMRIILKNNAYFVNTSLWPNRHATPVKYNIKVNLVFQPVVPRLLSSPLIEILILLSSNVTEDSNLNFVYFSLTFLEKRFVQIRKGDQALVDPSGGGSFLGVTLPHLHAINTYYQWME